MMLLHVRDNNIQSFAYIWLHKGNQNEFLNFQIRTLLQSFAYIWLHKRNQNKFLNFRMLKEFVLISFMKPDVRKTLNIIISGM